MAEASALEGAAAAEEKPAGGGRKLVLIAAAVLLLGGGGAAAWFMGVFGGDATPAEHADAGGHGEGTAADDGHGDGTAAPDVGALYALDPFIANLSDEDGRRYLKATLQVEFFKGQVPPEWGARLPQVRDLLLTLFSSKNFAEVRTPQGKAVLRDEIVTRLNHAMRQDMVKAVYFTEFIVQ